MSVSDEELARWEAAARKDNPSYWSSQALVSVFDRLRKTERELERQLQHNKLQQTTLHELHVRIKDKDAALARLKSSDA